MTLGVPAGGTAQRPRLLAILAYHAIGPPSPGGWTTWFYVPEALFADHLRVIRSSGWEVIDAERLICGLSDSTTLPHRAILITFDDAYQSLCRTAAPLLQDNAYPAIVFVPTAYIGGYNAFEPEGYAPREDICSVDDLRDLQRAGLSIQSHAVSHRKLSELTSEEYEDEFERSRSALEMLIGEPVRLLAYPYGDPGRDTRATAAALAQRGYEGAFLYGGDVLHMDEPVSRFALDRIAMGPDTQLREILLRAEGVESAGFYP